MSQNGPESAPFLFTVHEVGTLSDTAVILILISAFIHALWNLISKRSSPTAAFFMAANGIGAWIFFPVVIANRGVVFNMPGRIWALLILTGLFQALYCIALAAAYRYGELSITYPIARSLPVLLVPILTVILGRGELLGGWFLCGAALVLTGGIILSKEEILAFRSPLLLKSALHMAIWAALGTAGYSMVDDRALRIIRSSMGHEHGTVPLTLVYAFFEALACAAWLGIFVLTVEKGSRGTRFPVVRAASAGVLMHLTYGMVLLSMAYARDVSLIVAFRQVSVLIGAFMGMIYLKESRHRWKITGLMILFAGLVFVAMG